MKEGKTIIVVVLVALLVGAVVYLAVDKNPETPEEKALSDLKVRIGQLTVLKEEQTLTRDIMVIQQEVRELTLKAQAPPVIEGEFIPMERLPEELQD